jgi:rSAM/selenodomain-associated transferase 1
MYDEQVILLFIKAPVVGQVKSRLAADVGEETALVLYKNFVLDIVNTLEGGGYSFRICFYPAEGEKVISEWLGPHYQYMPQRGNDLGAKMENAFHCIFSEGAARGVLIGSDIPDLPSAMIYEAFELLKYNDAVIGPAADGGYYLIGFNRDSFLPCVFDGMSWSTDTVYQETVRVLQDASLHIHSLPLWKDVDTLDDLRSLLERNEDTMSVQSKTMEYLRNTRLLEKKGNANNE